ncbi:membrane-spanning 4-domains subfamily A member 4A-like [Loxodonta africana]|uniref:membrane-spanning 4-domains subfamily A member 4A-like n=1 Tax=Loxodonta africana TaxID=9785 RepID=UPI000C812318|nr:membrane-spanning 4-domains subfamily A member 4A-like isoform X1 [Loxodonta africana]
MTTPLRSQQTTPGDDSDVSQAGQAEKFLRGVLKDLGVIQILIALIKFSLGIILLYVLLPFYGPEPISVYIGFQMCGSVMFIVSGALSIAAGTRTTKHLDQGSLGLNIISSVMATTGVILSLNIISFDHPPCDYSQAPEICAMNRSMLTGMNGLVFILSVLEFCIAVSLSTSGCILKFGNSGGSVTIMP